MRVLYISAGKYVAMLGVHIRYKARYKVPYSEHSQTTALQPFEELGQTFFLIPADSYTRLAAMHDWIDKMRLIRSEFRDVCFPGCRT